MGRPTRNETIEALEAHQRGDIGGVPVGGRHYGAVITDVLRAYAELAPDTCPTCKGGTICIHGETHLHGEAEFGCAGPGLSETCPTCGGQGYVWPDKLIDTAMKSVRSVLADADFDEAEHVIRVALEAWWLEVGNDN